MKARVTALALALTVVGASTASAASITIGSNAGTTYTTSGIDDYSARSGQMNGMEITATWKVGNQQFTDTKTWNNGVNFAGLDFGLNVGGDTFQDGAWELDFWVAGEGRLQKLSFNGVPGNTVFDRTEPFLGTAGSNQGKDLAGFDWYFGNIKATYFDKVVVDNAAHGGDIYAGLDIEFLSSGGLGESDWLWLVGQDGYRFSLDTDIATSELLNQSGTLEAVPEPGSMVLLGTGLLGLAAAARRRARRS